MSNRTPPNHFNLITNFLRNIRRKGRYGQFKTIIPSRKREFDLLSRLMIKVGHIQMLSRCLSGEMIQRMPEIIRDVSCNRSQTWLTFPVKG